MGAFDPRTRDQIAGDWIKQLEAERDALAVRCAEAEKDAARLRFIIMQRGFQFVFNEPVEMYYPGWESLPDWVLPQIRQQIDAAMARASVADSALREVQQFDHENLRTTDADGGSQS